MCRTASKNGSPDTYVAVKNIIYKRRSVLNASFFSNMLCRQLLLERKRCPYLETVSTFYLPCFTREIAPAITNFSVLPNCIFFRSFQIAKAKAQKSPPSPEGYLRKQRVSS
jgi:hypothetical protein